LGMSFIKENSGLSISSVSVSVRGKYNFRLLPHDMLGNFWDYS
jgi:hypothetical protein